MDHYKKTMPLYGSCIVSSVSKSTVLSVHWQTVLTCISVRLQVHCRRFHVVWFLQDVPYALLIFYTVCICFHWSHRLTSLYCSQIHWGKAEVNWILPGGSPDERRNWPQQYFFCESLQQCVPHSLFYWHSVLIFLKLHFQSHGFFYVRSSAFTFNDESC